MRWNVIKEAWPGKSIEVYIRWLATAAWESEPIAHDQEAQVQHNHLEGRTSALDGALIGPRPAG